MYYENFARLCELSDVKPSQVSKATGISTATLSSWKKGLYTPKNDKLQKIANFFQVPIEYIRGESSVQLDEQTKINDMKAFDMYINSLGWEVIKDEEMCCLNGGQVSVSISLERYADFERKIRNECVSDILGFISERLSEEMTYLEAAHHNAMPEPGIDDSPEKDEELMDKHE